MKTVIVIPFLVVVLPMLFILTGLLVAASVIGVAIFALALAMEYLLNEVDLAEEARISKGL